MQLYLNRHSHVHTMAGVLRRSFGASVGWVRWAGGCRTVRWASASGSVGEPVMGANYTTEGPDPLIKADSEVSKSTPINLNITPLSPPPPLLTVLLLAASITVLPPPSTLRYRQLYNPTASADKCGLVTAVWMCVCASSLRAHAFRAVRAVFLFLA